jgi:hypothetical protein
VQMPRMQITSAARNIINFSNCENKYIRISNDLK